MNLYLLKVREAVGDRYETVNRVLVEATSPGYAKYHWHKLMNQQGSMKTGHHFYENWDLGLVAELEGVREVGEDEAEVLEEVLTKIPGFDPE